MSFSIRFLQNVDSNSSTCSILNSGFEPPNNFLLYTENTLTKVESDSEHIAKIISSLHPNKAHGHDMHSIRMLKLCGIHLQTVTSYF